jgi:hypothetical protein
MIFSLDRHEIISRHELQLESLDTDAIKVSVDAQFQVPP